MAQTKEKPWQWKEGDLTVTRTTRWTGPGCHLGCGVVYYTKGNQLVKVEGDPDNPFNQGRLCPRCLYLPEAVHHPDRLKHPMKRVGERGENKWEEITWDEAYSIIEKNVREIQKDFGPEAIVGLMGTGRNIWEKLPKLIYSGFGSPNICMGFLSGSACYIPRSALMVAMNGDFVVPDLSQLHEDRYDNPEWKKPECIVIWGNDPVVSNSDGFYGHWVVDCMKMGSELIVIDPRVTWLASKAKYHLQLRPGTDGALALGMLKIIIDEGLYDQDFIDKWTFGFDRLKEVVKDYTLEKVAEITWLPAELIKAATLMYANSKPAAIQWGLALDMAKEGVATAHAVACLWTITGNLDVPGGNVVVKPALGSPVIEPDSHWGIDDIPEETRRKQIGADKYPLVQLGIGGSAQPDEVLKAMETGKPYPIKMLYLATTNPIANTAADAPRVYQAMLKVPFIVVADLFMTPTAMGCADLVLPVATSPERDSLRAWWRPYRAMVKVLQSSEDIKTDEEIILELGKRLEPDEFPWETVKDLFNWALAKGNKGLTFENMVENVYWWPKFEYRKYEKCLLREDGNPGFNTISGRAELYLNLFENFGIQALPFYDEPPESPYSRPDLFKEYPLILTTGARSWVFFHSENRQQASARQIHPDPLVQMHPDTAAKYGIENGDWVWIENHRGRCRQRAKLTPIIDPKFIQADHGWWFPEKPAEAPSLYGVFESNINNLTAMGQVGETGFGAPYKCLLCKVYKVQEGEM